MGPIRASLGLFLSLVAIVLAVPVVLVALLFSVVSGLTRLLAGVLEPPHVAWRDLLAFEPEIGWKPSEVPPWEPLQLPGPWRHSAIWTAASVISRHL